MEQRPESVCVRVGRGLASDLFRAVAKLTPFNDKALYDPALQKRIYESMRAVTPDGCDLLVEEIRRRLVEPPYFAYVTGLEFDQANLLLVGLTGAFGDVVEPYNQSWSCLVRYIRPTTDRTVLGSRVLNENLHTDGTDWRHPNDLTCLLCIRPDQNSGGRSLLMDLPTVISEVENRIGKSGLAVLHDESLPWRIAEELGGGIVYASVLGGGKIRWLHYTTKSAVDSGLAVVPKATAELLQALDDMLAMTERANDFLAEPGALTIIHNKRCLHARTAIANPEMSERLVLRTKVQRPVFKSIAPRPSSWEY